VFLQCGVLLQCVVAVCCRSQHRFPGARANHEMPRNARWVAVCCCSVVLQCVVAVWCCSVLLQCVVAADTDFQALVQIMRCLEMLSGLQCVVAVWCCSVWLQCGVAVCCCSVLSQPTQIPRRSCKL